jgi:hypothetical protein
MGAGLYSSGKRTLRDLILSRMPSFGGIGFMGQIAGIERRAMGLKNGSPTPCRAKPAAKSGRSQFPM